MAVQNHYGTWSAPKGHRKIKENGVETAWETFLREFLEEISVIFKGKKIRKILTQESIIRFIVWNKEKIYLECKMDKVRGMNDRLRTIGLFFIRINEKKLKFKLTNENENKVFMNFFLNWKNKLKY